MVVETQTEVVVKIPKFCHLMRTEWTITLDRRLVKGDNDALELLARFSKKAKGEKASFSTIYPFAVTVTVNYDGGETIRIPKDPRILLVSILATGSPESMSRDNWAYTSYKGTVGSYSAPVNTGMWGECP